MRLHKRSAVRFDLSLFYPLSSTVYRRLSPDSQKTIVSLTRRVSRVLDSLLAIHSACERINVVADYGIEHTR
jgi:hypothetical protein